MSTSWNLDGMHSQIGFKVKHMMISNVSGDFGKFNASIETEGDDFSTAKFDFSAEIESINTGVSDRDAHLKSDDFFNAETYPNMTFISTNIQRKGDEIFAITGDLTIRDVTRSINLDAEFGGVAVDPYGQTKTGFSITGKIKRSDFGLKWSAVTEAGSIVVSDEVKLNAELQFIKKV